MAPPPEKMQKYRERYQLLALTAEGLRRRKRKLRRQITKTEEEMKAALGVTRLASSQKRSNANLMEMYRERSYVKKEIKSRTAAETTVRTSIKGLFDGSSDEEDEEGDVDELGSEGEHDDIDQILKMSKLLSASCDNLADEETVHEVATQMKSYLTVKKAASALLTTRSPRARRVKEPEKRDSVASDISDIDRLIALSEDIVPSRRSSFALPSLPQSRKGSEVDPMPALHNTISPRGSIADRESGSEPEADRPRIQPPRGPPPEIKV